jgi:hypothetical protein
LGKNNSIDVNLEEKRKQSLSNLPVTQQNQIDEDKATKKPSINQEEPVDWSCQ